MKIHSIAASVPAFFGWTIGVLAGPALSTLDPEDAAIDDAAKAVVIEDGSPWFVTGGATVRSINAGFRLDGHDHVSLDWRRYVHRNSGKGDVGLFRGGLGSIRYNDGSAGPGNEYRYSYDGTAYTAINTPGQYRETGHPSIYTATFHTDGYGYGSHLARQTVNVSDSDVGVGPQITLGRNLLDDPNFLLNIVTGWSFVSTDHSSGNRVLANLAVNETRSFYSYTYDTSYGPVGADPGFLVQGFPFVDDPNGLGLSLLVFDVNGGFANEDFLDPRKGISQSSHRVAQFYAVGRADLDVNLNEIPLGLEVGRQMGPVQLFLTGGATLNVIDYDLTSQLTWYRRGRSGALATERWRDSGAPVKVGLYGGLTARMPLTDSGNVYLEAHGAYRWIDPVHASAGFVDVEIDPSSWEGGLGIGIVLP